MTEENYSERVAFELISIIYDDLNRTITREQFDSFQEDRCLLEYKPRLKELINKYYDPSTFDALTITTNKIIRNKKTVQRNLSDIIKNINNINDLVDQSNDLSYSSQQLFKKTKTLKKKCCKLM